MSLLLCIHIYIYIHIYIHIYIYMYVYVLYYEERRPAEVVSEAPTEMKPGDGENTEVCPARISRWLALSALQCRVA